MDCAMARQIWLKVDMEAENSEESTVSDKDWKNAKFHIVGAPKIGKKPCALCMRALHVKIVRPRAYLLPNDVREEGDDWPIPD